MEEKRGGEVKWGEGRRGGKIKWRRREEERSNLERWLSCEVGNEIVHCDVLTVHVFVNKVSNLNRHHICIQEVVELHVEEEINESIINSATNNGVANDN